MPQSFPARRSIVSRVFSSVFWRATSKSLTTWWKERFLLAVESNLILYGFDGEAFFTRQFDSPEEFKETRATLTKRLPMPGFYAREGD